MSYRLPADANLIGYWGFDEAMETDLGLDEGLGARHLTVSASLGVEAGRIGNARVFDGTATFASPSSSVPFQLIDDMTIITWFKLSSYNSTGSFLRTIFACDGPLTTDNILYSLVVDSSGRLIYRHTSSSGTVVLSTTIDTVKINQIYNVVLRRIDAGAGTQNIELYIDNTLTSWTTVTVNAVPSALPVPKPVTSASATLKFGKSHKETDSAFWHGFIDETSIHDVVRTLSPYLITVYFSHTVNNPTNKLTGGGDAKNISSYEMGHGVRWWCFERNSNLYVTKESPMGYFGSETQLTTVGNNRYSTTGKPELIYDPASDTLYVFFVAGNRIYKLTANATDNPATINMPFSADSPGVLKSLDHQDGGGFGDGSGGQRELREDDIIYVNRSAVKVSSLDTIGLGDGPGGQLPYSEYGTPNKPYLNFGSTPSSPFGLVAGPVDAEMSNYIFYKIEGARFIPMPAGVLLKYSPGSYGGHYFLSVPSRSYGDKYIAEALDVMGRRTGIFTEAVVDHFEEILVEDGVRYVYGRDSTGTELGSLGDGSGGQRELREDDIIYVNRSAVKISKLDTPVSDLGDGSGGQAGFVTQAGITVMI